MTTVAYRDGQLAFDSRVTHGNLNIGTCTKGRRTKNLIMAGCGAASDIEAVLDWIEAGAEEDSKKNFGLHGREVDCEVLVADKKGNITFYEGYLYPLKVEGLFHAMGSGGDIAIGAMAYGATAKEAVQIAAKYDVYTGSPIRVISFDQKK